MVLKKRPRKKCEKCGKEYTYTGSHNKTCGNSMSTSSQSSGTKELMHNYYVSENLSDEASRKICLKISSAQKNELNSSADQEHSNATLVETDDIKGKKEELITVSIMAQQELTDSMPILENMTILDKVPNLEDDGFEIIETDETNFIIPLETSTHKQQIKHTSETNGQYDKQQNIKHELSSEISQQPANVCPMPQNRDFSHAGLGTDNTLESNPESAHRQQFMKRKMSKPVEGDDDDEIREVCDAEFNKNQKMPISRSNSTSVADVNNSRYMPMTDKLLKNVFTEKELQNAAVKVYINPINGAKKMTITL